MSEIYGVTLPRRHIGPSFKCIVHKELILQSTVHDSEFSFIRIAAYQEKAVQQASQYRANLSYLTRMTMVMLLKNWIRP